MSRVTDSGIRIVSSGDDEFAPVWESPPHVSLNTELCVVSLNTELCVVEVEVEVDIIVAVSPMQHQLTV